MKTRAQTAAQQRERRARVAAAVLGVVFLGVCAIQVPRVLKQLHGGQGADASAAAAAGAPAVAEAGTPALAAATAPVAAPRRSLGRFGLKDPFAQQLQATTTAAPAAPPPAPRAPAQRAPAATPATPKRLAAPAAVPAPVVASASPTQRLASKPLPAKRISAKRTATGSPGVLVLFDGRRLGLLRGDVFPRKAPVFRLVSFRKGLARLQLLGGTLADGGAVLTLRAGHRVVLRDESAGTRYVLLYVRPAPVLPRAAAAK